MPSPMAPGGEAMLWWKVAMHLDEAQLSLTNALAVNVDDPRMIQLLHDTLRDGQAILLEIFRAKGLLPAPLPTAGQPVAPPPPPAAMPEPSIVPLMPAPPDVMPTEVEADVVEVIEGKAAIETEDHSVSNGASTTIEPAALTTAKPSVGAGT